MIRRLRALVPAALTANVVARIVALAALALATILVARAGGPTYVGELTLLRVLPGLAGVLASCGLPTAAPYFLARPDDAARPQLRPTLVLLGVAGAFVATGGWLALTPLLHRVFFQAWGTSVVLAAAIPVFSQLWVAVGKSFLQGENDMRGANLAIGAEETAFIPVYLALTPFAHGTVLLVAALVLADVLVAIGIGVRLAGRGYLRGLRRADLRLAWSVCRYGMRAQLGGLLTLVNLRLDVAILGAFAGPAVLGVYAVASKFAELLRLPGLAVTYVLYPRLAARSADEASRRAGGLLPRALGLTVLSAIPLLAAVPLLPLVYGHAFAAAVVPAYILLAGLLGEGVAGVATAYLYGVGRPGTNSLAIGVAVVVTVLLDILLIPRLGAVGAALASSAAYATSSAVLVGFFFNVRHTLASRTADPTTLEAS